MRDTRNALACAVRLCTCRPVPLSRSAMSDSAAPWTVACQALLSKGVFQARIYWSGLPCPPPGDLPKPGITPSLPRCRRILHHLNHQGNPPPNSVNGLFILHTHVSLHPYLYMYIYKLTVCIWVYLCFRNSWVVQ